MASIRTRLFVAFLLVALATAVGLSLYFLDQLESYGLRKLEERLDTQSRILGAVFETVYAREMETGATGGTALDRLALTTAMQRVSPDLETRLRVVERSGALVADSAGNDEIGDSYLDRPEIRRALAGSYGAATRVTRDGRVALYVAEPIRVEDRVVGAAYSSSTTFSVRTLLRAYRDRLALLVLAFAGVALIVAEGAARWLSRPIRELEAAADAFTAGDHTVRAQPAGSRETRALGEAFNELAGEVEGLLAELRDEERRKSQFVSDVSHEIRTPLTAIRGAAETLLDGDVDEEHSRRFLATIAREAERLGRLANDLLTLQRIEGTTGELPIRRIELGQVARLAANALEPLVEARAVRLEVVGEAGPVLGDPDRLQQALANLMDNATRVTPPEHAVTVRLRNEDGRAVLTVTDEGPGVPADALPHIFDRFFRAEASRDRGTGGAGLGLAIVRAIVTAHSGEVTAENLPEGGSRFTVRLPLTPK